MLLWPSNIFVTFKDGIPNNLSHQTFCLPIHPIDSTMNHQLTGLTRTILLALSLFLFVSAHAQDPVFSQFFSQKLYLNPAFTGYEPGTVISTATRRQWGNLASNPLTPNGANFTTNHVEISQDLPGFHSGFGLAFTDNSEGEGQYNLTSPNNGLLRWQRATFSYAFHSWDCDFYEGIEDDVFGFSIGGYARWNRFVLDWQNLVFGDQLDPIYGVVRGTSVPLPDAGISDIEDWDFGIGGVAHLNVFPRHSIRFGGAWHHISLPNNSVAGNEERLPGRVTLHASDIILLGFGGEDEDEKYQIIPNGRLELQRASAAWDPDNRRSFREKPVFMNEVTLGVMAKTPSRGNVRLSGGLWFSGNPRWSVDSINIRGPEQSIVSYLGIDVVTESGGNTTTVWELGLSWDHNLGGIQSVGDIFELTFSIGLPLVTLPGAGCFRCRKNQIRSRF